MLHADCVALVTLIDARWGPCLSSVGGRAMRPIQVPVGAGGWPDSIACVWCGRLLVWVSRRLAPAGQCACWWARGWLRVGLVRAAA